MGIKTKELPLDLMKQDANTGMWKFGSIEMTSAEYATALQLNDIREDLKTFEVDIAGARDEIAEIKKKLNKK